MKFELNKIYAFLLVTICFVMVVKAQSEAKDKTYRIARSNIGVGGTSKIVSTSKGSYKVSQSIGQSSVIGTYSKNGYYLRQGYQQPHTKIKVDKFESSNINVTVYPNPFNQYISLSFDDKMTENVSVTLYDIVGKLVYSKDFKPAKTIQLNLKNFSNGAYMLKAISKGKLFKGKLIKI